MEKATNWHPRAIHNRQKTLPSFVFLLFFVAPQYILRSRNHFVIVYMCSNIGFYRAKEGDGGRNQKCGWCVQREILIHKLLHRSRDYPKKSLFRHVRWIWRRELFFIAFQLFLLLRWLSFSYEHLQGNLLSRLKSPSGFFLFQFSCENISAKILSRSPSLDFLKIDLSGIRDPF